MREIPLTQGKVALVDDEDFARIGHLRWCAVRHPREHTEDVFYAARRGVESLERMHRVILGLTDSKTQVDHINGDGLDNRRCNLRIASQSENLANARSNRGTSRFKGVYYNKARSCWVAQLGRSTLGTFDDEEEAARVYDAAAVDRFGDCARLNFDPVENPAADFTHNIQCGSV